jgi:hypothetical protein
MTIRFAAARRGDSVVRRVLSTTAPCSAANDNMAPGAGDMMLRAALRHFAAHGLGAAEAARVNAEAAFFAGDRIEYRWWLGICRMLDRRMAEAAAARREAANQG